MSTVIKSTEPCPVCLLDSRVHNPLENRPGQFESYCKAGHKFPDTDELRVLSQQARSKYPGFYKGPTPPTPDPAAATRDIVIDPEAKQLIEEASGISITSASDIKGLVRTLAEGNKEKETELRSLRATIGAMSRRTQNNTKAAAGQLGPNQMILTLPEWAMGGITGQAEYSNKTVEEWVNDEVTGFMDNYFGAIPKQV